MEKRYHLKIGEGKVLKLKLRNGKALTAFEMMPSQPILLRAK
jgi:hypothetical protein